MGVIYPIARLTTYDLREGAQREMSEMATTLRKPVDWLRVTYAAMLNNKQQDNRDKSLK